MKQGSYKLLVYCEKGAYAPEIKKLWRAGRINLIHFPYDPGDRRWHDKQKIPFARPSLVTINTCELRITDAIVISDTVGSDMHGRIARLLGKHLKDFDARHFDSACKSGANVFATRDTDYDGPADELYELTGVRVVNPNKPDQLSMLASLIAVSAAL